MARAGRKHKEGAKRYASGDVVRERGTAPATIRRLKEAALAGMQDARWGTEAGRLLLLGRIDEKQYEAGQRWMALYARASRSMLSRPNVASPSDFNRTNGVPADPDSDRGIEEARRHLRDMEAYQKGLAKLAATQRPNVTRSIVGVFERDEVMIGNDLADLTCGLNVLCEFFGLTQPVKSVSVGK